MFAGNKIIGDLKNGEIRNFLRNFIANKSSLGVFHGALGLPNFFVTGQCAKNCISAIKLLAISKIAKLEFFRTFGPN